MLETKTAITANPAANSAKAASSSCTKYNWAATTAARNHHIHLRLLSSVLVIGPDPLWKHSLVKLGSCFCARLLSVWAKRLAPEPLDTLRKAKSMVQKTHFYAQTSLLVPKVPTWVSYHDENKRYVLPEEYEIVRPSFAILRRGYCTSGQADRFIGG